MYVSMKSMLEHARENGYAVMAVNCVNMEEAKACIESAVEEKSPIILNISPRQMRLHGHSYAMQPMIQKMAENADVPIAFNLDHGASYAEISDAIRDGFTSVMIDASSCSFEENVHRTQLVSAMAHAKGLSCEAELGHVGDALSGDGGKADYYTSVDQAVEFVKRTNCDCLAVAIGTAHGSYPKGMIPKLDFKRLSELHDALDIPLVLHGGSGAGSENIQKAVELGINKINVNTDIMILAVDVMKQALKENPDYNYMDLMILVEDSIKTYIKDYMRLIKSSGRYVFNTEQQKAQD
ncbi:MAG: class II fructose-bisphosphate aldolase [Longicatena sp.]